MIFTLLISFPPVSLCVLSLCTPNLDFEREGCWRTRVTHDRRTVFFTNECQTLEGVDHSRNRQSKAHSFCFSRKLKPTSMAQESKRQVTSPNAPLALRLRARTLLVSWVGCAKRAVKKDRFLAVISAETKPSLSALLPFSHQFHLLAAVIQPLLLDLPLCVVITNRLSTW